MNLTNIIGKVSDARSPHRPGWHARNEAKRAEKPLEAVSYESDDSQSTIEDSEVEEETLTLKPYYLASIEAGASDVAPYPQETKTGAGQVAQVDMEASPYIARATVLKPVVHQAKEVHVVSSQGTYKTTKPVLVADASEQMVRAVENPVLSRKRGLETESRTSQRGKSEDNPFRDNGNSTSVKAFSIHSAFPAHSLRENLGSAPKRHRKLQFNEILPGNDAIDATTLYQHVPNPIFRSRVAVAADTRTEKKEVHSAEGLNPSSETSQPHAVDVTPKKSVGRVFRPMVSPFYVRPSRTPVTCGKVYTECSPAVVSQKELSPIQVATGAPSPSKLAHRPYTNLGLIPVKVARKENTNVSNSSLATESGKETIPVSAVGRRKEIIPVPVVADADKENIPIVVSKQTEKSDITNPTSIEPSLHGARKTDTAASVEDTAMDINNTTSDIGLDQIPKVAGAIITDGITPIQGQPETLEIANSSELSAGVATVPLVVPASIDAHASVPVILPVDLVGVDKPNSGNVNVGVENSVSSESTSIRTDSATPAKAEQEPQTRLVLASNEIKSKKNENHTPLRQTTPPDDETDKEESSVEPEAAPAPPIAEIEPFNHPGPDVEPEEAEIPEEILEEMLGFEKSFKGLTEKYRLMDKIGEGTFSSVYKAEALKSSVTVDDSTGIGGWQSPPLRKNGAKESLRGSNMVVKTPVVALKRIYVTSSPQRIHNELMLLYMLEGCSRVATLLDILRYQDQVVAVTPFYEHSDFRDFYRDLPIEGIKIYMFELLSALDFIHAKKIIHRDIKPTNFLYDPFKRKGVLLDFGLAEQMASPAHASGNSWKMCPCLVGGPSADEIIKINSYSIQGYPKDDTRPGRRANRAGTRGFRAPEVLFKCSNQSTQIDIWSAGVILLSLLTRRFPFFNSPDDIDALCELTMIFGLGVLKKCARLHGLGLETSIPGMSRGSGYSMGQLIHWTVNNERVNDTLPKDSVAYEVLQVLDVNGDLVDQETFTKNQKAAALDDPNAGETEEVVDRFRQLSSDYSGALELLDGCFEMDPRKRVTASEALQSPFFSELNHMLSPHRREVRHSNARRSADYGGDDLAHSCQLELDDDDDVLI